MLIITTQSPMQHWNTPSMMIFISLCQVSIWTPETPGFWAVRFHPPLTPTLVTLGFHWGVKAKTLNPGLRERVEERSVFCISWPAEELVFWQQHRGSNYCNNDNGNKGRCDCGCRRRSGSFQCGRRSSASRDWELVHALWGKCNSTHFHPVFILRLLCFMRDSSHVDRMLCRNIRKWEVPGSSNSRVNWSIQGWSALSISISTMSATVLQSNLMRIPASLRGVGWIKGPKDQLDIIDSFKSNSSDHYKMILSIIWFSNFSGW